MTTSRSLVLVALAVALVGLPAPADATTMYEFSLSELTYVADLVVEAEVEQVVAERHEGSAYLLSVATLRLTRVVKGEAIEGDRLLVREWGGVLNGEVTDLPSAPVYTEGERVLVFLEQENRPDPLWRTVGLNQGKWSLIREADTGRDIVLKVARDRATPRFVETSVQLPAQRTYCDAIVSDVARDLTLAYVPPYERIPGVPQWKDDRFRADAQAAGQAVDPRWDAVRSDIARHIAERQSQEPRR